ncbi:uncharacterized protein LOC100179075 isoform X2 [Ciona intestinalis]
MDEDFQARNENVQAIAYNSIRAACNQNEEIYFNEPRQENAGARQINAQPVQNKRRSQKFWKIFAIIIFAVIIAVGAVVIHYTVANKAAVDCTSTSSQNSGDKVTTTTTTTNTPTNTPTNTGTYGTLTNPALSCLDIKNTSGVTNDGYYFLQPSGTVVPFQAFCDMTTSGGGWTLVASVHENDINGKCTTGDMWFSNDLARYSLFSRNWENTNQFGKADKATSADYKNIGYSSIKAANIMLRHVPNKTPVDQSKSFASLQYHTSNNFLGEHGGNLFTTYTRHYPMNPKSTVVTFPSNVDKLVDDIAALSTNITSGIPDFYKYTYGSTTDRLQDGGNGTYTSYGMQIYFGFYCGYNIRYGSEYKCSSVQSLVISRKSHPFIAVIAIENPSLRTSSGQFQIRAYRPSTDSITSYNGKMTEGNFELQYRARCVYGRNVPSVCDVVLAVKNTKDWFSSSTFTLSESTSRNTDFYYYDVYINNYPRRIMVGYTMLSRTGGRLVTKVQMESALQKMLQPFKNYTWPAPCAFNHLVVPVTYTIGESTLSNFVPPSMHSATTTGFLQIRAESYDGTYYAMCPAVKLNNCDGQYICIGGVKNGYTQSNDCNDYTDWNGVTNSPDYHTSKTYAHSTTDIESTIMIFYR